MLRFRSRHPTRLQIITNVMGVCVSVYLLRALDNRKAGALNMLPASLMISTFDAGSTRSQACMPHSRKRVLSSVS